ncbi:MAG: GNAT family N-acetyltransferase [Gammaproteobacteria bacterium]|nr:GNAT family N-acetyltransferase [Gammaproteobacteria bacterium]MBU1831290.1 GNAT family N-acetyltransferase [Gammaproteobacteria bacterium]
MIREATMNDLEHLVLLMFEMHEESRFASLEFDVEKSVRLLTGCILSDDQMLVVYETKGEIVGGIAAYVVEHLTSLDRIAGDFGLFLAQGSRGGLIAARLVKYFLNWAQLKDAKLTQMGISTGVNVEQTGRLYEALGGKCFGGLYEFKGGA